MFSPNIGSVVVLSFMVPLASGTTAWLAGADDGWVIAIFVTTFVALEIWLLGAMRCPHCRRLLMPGAFPLLHPLFWQSYFYFGGRCPHCGRAAEGWWH